MKGLDNISAIISRHDKVFIVAIILFSFLIGTLLTYEVEGFNISSIVARSLALLLVPASSSIIIFVISILVKKKMTRNMFINLVSILWLLGASADLITYYFL